MLVLRDFDNNTMAAFLKAQENGSIASLMEQFAYLDRFGIREGDATSQIVTLWPGRDGTDFTVTWYRRKPGVEVRVQVIKNLVNEHGRDFCHSDSFREKYEPAYMNGGLIYFTSSNDWSVHT